MSSSPESSTRTSSGDRLPRVFVGFPYSEPYRARYASVAAAAIRASGWDPTMPLGEVPGGILIARIAAMIAASDRAVYEVGAENGNVWFEMGISVAIRQPTALMTDRDPAELPGILRSAWLRHYRDNEACLADIRGFLALADPAPHAPASLGSGDTALVTVVGTGDRTRALVDALRAAEHEVVSRPPSAIRSLSEAVEMAESSGALIGVRPDATAWDGDDATATLTTLGAAFGLRREVIAAAGPAEPVPSDCEQLVVRGAGDSDLAAGVLALLGRNSPALPPSGTVRPRIFATLPRPLRTSVSDALRNDGRALISGEPGYGKTTLLSQVADGLECPVAWVSTEANWTTGELLERIVVAVGQHAPRFGWEAWAAVIQSRQVAEQVGGRGIASTRSAPGPARRTVGERRAARGVGADTARGRRCSQGR